MVAPPRWSARTIAGPCGALRQHDHRAGPQRHQQADDEGVDVVQRQRHQQAVGVADQAGAGDRADIGLDIGVAQGEGLGSAGRARGEHHHRRLVRRQRRQRVPAGAHASSDRQGQRRAPGSRRVGLGGGALLTIDRDDLAQSDCIGLGNQRRLFGADRTAGSSRWRRRSSPPRPAGQRIDRDTDRAAAPIARRTAIQSGPLAANRPIRSPGIDAARDKAAGDGGRASGEGGRAQPLDARIAIVAEHARASPRLATNSIRLVNDGSSSPMREDTWSSVDRLQQGFSRYRRRLATVWCDAVALLRAVQTGVRSGGARAQESLCLLAGPCITPVSASGRQRGERK